MGYSKKQRERLFEIVGENSAHSVSEERSSEGDWTVWVLRDGCGDPDGDPFDYFEDLLDFVCGNNAINAVVREDEILNPELIEINAWRKANDPDGQWSYA